METVRMHSRRLFVTGLAIAATVPVAPNAIANSAAAEPADAQLLALGRLFDSIAAQIDGAKFELNLLETFDRVHSKIIATPAKTIEGLRVKARAECWALLGDFDHIEAPSTRHAMALSIVRDLIRLYDPSLEDPGAVQRLVEDDQL